jgi:hypothetical protein
MASLIYYVALAILAVSMFALFNTQIWWIPALCGLAMAGLCFERAGSE